MVQIKVYATAHNELINLVCKTPDRPSPFHAQMLHVTYIKSISLHRITHFPINSPIVKIIIRERVEVLFNHVIVDHSFINLSLVLTHNFWDSFEVISLFCEVFDRIGTLPKLVRYLLELITDLMFNSITVCIYVVLL